MGDVRATQPAESSGRSQRVYIRTCAQCQGSGLRVARSGLRVVRLRRTVHGIWCKVHGLGLCPWGFDPTGKVQKVRLKAKGQIQRGRGVLRVASLRHSGQVPRSGTRSGIQSARLMIYELCVEVALRQAQDKRVTRCGLCAVIRKLISRKGAKAQRNILFLGNPFSTAAQLEYRRETMFE
jgi:hypothetical protein